MKIIKIFLVFFLLTTLLIAKPLELLDTYLIDEEHLFKTEVYAEDDKAVCFVFYYQDGTKEIKYL